jgi:DNA-binding transcriptional MerR regulator
MNNKTKEYLSKKRNFIPNVDWFDEHFTCNFLYSDLKVKEGLNERRNTLAKDEVTSRILTHWQSEGLISDDRPEGKGWRKYSISEQIWIKCIIKLRGFGMDLKKIKRVKEYLEIYYSDKNPSKYPELDFYIVLASASEEPVKLIVFQTGEAMLALQRHIDIALQYKMIVDDFISIDLNRIVNEGFKNKDIKTDYIDYAKSNIEKEVTKNIFEKGIRTIKLTIDNGNEYHLDHEYILDSKRELEGLFNKLKYVEKTEKKIGRKIIYKITDNKRIRK